MNEAGQLLGEALSGNVTASAGRNLFIPRDGGLCLGKAECIAAQSEVMKFVGPGTKAVPVWLAVTYLSSNTVLNSLNFYWFGKMIETVRKRFEKKPAGEKNDAGKTDDKDDKGNEKRNNVRRRTSSIVLDVADGLEKDERLRLMMDGAVDMDGKIKPETAEQRRDIEAKLERNGKSSALDGSADGARKR